MSEATCIMHERLHCRECRTEPTVTSGYYVVEYGPRGTTFCRKCLCSFLTGSERDHERNNPRQHPVKEGA